MGRRKVVLEKGPGQHGAGGQKANKRREGPGQHGAGGQKESRPRKVARTARGWWTEGK